MIQAILPSTVKSLEAAFYPSLENPAVAGPSSSTPPRKPRKRAQGAQNPGPRRARPGDQIPHPSPTFAATPQK